MNGIKSIITYIMFVTGAALVILAVFSAFLNVEIHFVPTVFEVFAANILIILGLFLRWKFEFRYILLEYLVDVTYIIVVLIAFGFIFNWFSLPVWHLVVMAVVIYILGIVVLNIKFRKDTNEMNELLQKRKKKQADNAT